MIVNKKRGFKRRYEYGGRGIFDNLVNLGTKLFTSNVAKQIGSSVLDVGKSVAKEGAKKALEAGKSAAVDATGRLVKKAFNRKRTTKDILQEYASLPDDNKISKGNGHAAIEKLIKKLNKGSGIKTT